MWYLALQRAGQHKKTAVHGWKRNLKACTGRGSVSMGEGGAGGVGGGVGLAGGGSWGSRRQGRGQRDPDLPTLPNFGQSSTTLSPISTRRFSRDLVKPLSCKFIAKAAPVPDSIPSVDTVVAYNVEDPPPAAVIDP
jgi:hypothetical protein